MSIITALFLDKKTARIQKINLTCTDPPRICSATPLYTLSKSNTFVSPHASANAYSSTVDSSKLHAIYCSSYCDAALAPIRPYVGGPNRCRSDR